MVFTNLKAIMAKSRVIIALDVDTYKQAAKLVRRLGGLAGGFKIGLQLISSPKGNVKRLIKLIHSFDCLVFFDGKFHDIPNTMEQASRNIADLGVELFNVHASAGKKSMEYSAKVKDKSKLLAVTVLTTLDDDDTKTIYNDGVIHKVMQFARDAKNAGCDGIVCSAKELVILRTSGEFDKDFIMVVPGIRPEWAGHGDQKRVMTPREAILAGATFLVIGRPITNPGICTSLEAIIRINDEVESALKEVA